MLRYRNYAKLKTDLTSKPIWGILWKTVDNFGYFVSKIPESIEK